MLVQPMSYHNDKTYFSGKIGKSTLLKAKQYLSKEDYNSLKRARFGKNPLTNIELVRENVVNFDDFNRNHVQHNLFAIITNVKKNLTPVKIHLGADDMPLDKLFFAKLSNAVVKAEDILSKIKPQKR